MTVTVARDTIVCPRCGSQRIVTTRQRRRSLADGGIPCSNCRGIGQTRGFTDNDLRFWLRRFDCPCPTDVPVRTFIAAGGAPAELVELAKAVYPT